MAAHRQLDNKHDRTILGHGLQLETELSHLVQPAEQPGDGCAGSQQDQLASRAEAECCFLPACKTWTVPESLSAWYLKLHPESLQQGRCKTSLPQRQQRPVAECCICSFHHLMGSTKGLDQ